MTLFTPGPGAVLIAVTPIVPTSSPSSANTGDWFQRNMLDSTLQSLARSDFNRDGAITRNDMLGLFQQAESSSVVTTADVHDFRALVAAAGMLNMPGYVSELASKVVNGNPANVFCGGNLYAGASSTLLKSLVSQWFQGQDALSGQWAGISFSSASGTLFGAGGPSYTDVYQGALGDCTLMASLAEVAARDPGIIQNMFIPDGDGTYTVRFYHNGAADYVTVNTVLPGGGNLDARVHNGVLWVALAEKAIVEENESGWLATLSPKSNSYAAIDNGSTGTTVAYLSAITGMSAGGYAINPTNVATAWQSGKLIVLISGNTSFPHYIEHNHAYAMVGYSGSGSTPFLLFNPWGISGGYDSTGTFYYGETWVNGPALSIYCTASAIASTPAVTSTQATSFATTVDTAIAVPPVTTTASPVADGSPVPGTTIAAASQAQTSFAIDRLFAAWDDDGLPPMLHQGLWDGFTDLRGCASA